MSTVLFKKPEGMSDRKLHYCPGCAHGIVHRLVAECVAELGQVDNTIITAPVGCSVFIPNYFNYDTIHCAHGRAPATATGIKSRYYISGRRRPCIYRYSRNHPLCSQRREDYNSLHQQWYLRYDRRPDGSYNTSRHEGYNMSVRP